MQFESCDPCKLRTFLIHVSLVYCIVPNNKISCLDFSYNGALVTGEAQRKKSKFTLCKRADANGVKPSKKQFVSNPKEKKVRQCWSGSSGVTDWQCQEGFDPPLRMEGSRSCGGGVILVPCLSVCHKPNLLVIRFMKCKVLTHSLLSLRIF